MGVALLGGIRPSTAKAASQFIVFMIIGLNLASGVVSIGPLTGYSLLGAIFGGLLGLAAFGIGHAILGRRAATRHAARRSWTADLRSWRGRIARLAGWQYSLRLGSCMIVAEVIASLLPGPHSYWILLTPPGCGSTYGVGRGLSLGLPETARCRHGR